MEGRTVQLRAVILVAAVMGCRAWLTVHGRASMIMGTKWSPSRMKVNMEVSMSSSPSSGEVPREKPPSPFPQSSLFPSPQTRGSGYAESLRQIREQRQLREEEGQQLRTRGDIETRLAKARAKEAASASKKKKGGKTANLDRYRYFSFKRRFMTVRLCYDRWDKTFQVSEVPALQRTKAFRSLPLLMRGLFGLLWPLYAPVLLFKHLHLQWRLYQRTLKRVRLPSFGIVAWDAMRLYLLLGVILVVDILWGQFLEVFTTGLKLKGWRGWTSHVREQWVRFWQGLGELDLEAGILRQLGDGPIQRTADPPAG